MTMIQQRDFDRRGADDIVVNAVCTNWNMQSNSPTINSIHITIPSISASKFMVINQKLFYNGYGNMNANRNVCISFVISLLINVQRIKLDQSMKLWCHIVLKRLSSRNNSKEITVIFFFTQIHIVLHNEAALIMMNVREREKEKKIV